MHKEILIIEIPSGGSEKNAWRQEEDEDTKEKKRNSVPFPERGESPHERDKRSTNACHVDLLANLRPGLSPLHFRGS